MIPSFFRNCLSSVGVVLLLAVACGSVVAEQKFLLTQSSSLAVADVAQGSKLLTADDDFTRSLSRFDLEVRLKTDRPVTLDDWKKTVVAEVRPWDAVATEAFGKAATAAAERLRPFELPLPETIWVIRTTGKEEGEAAYTRGSAIILPEKVLRYDAEKLTTLLLHEIFHVLSRHAPELRARLYGLIGFRIVREIPLPEGFRDRKITNPDAPQITAVIDLPYEGKVVSCAPVLYSSAERYDPRAGGSLFKYMLFRLLVLRNTGGLLTPALAGTNPIVIDPKPMKEYFDSIGRNTNYIIHPDEILADNFVHLALGREGLATPKLVEDMREILVRK